MGKKRLLPLYTSLCVSLVGVTNNYLASAGVDLRLGIRLVNFWLALDGLFSWIIIIHL